MKTYKIKVAAKSQADALSRASDFAAKLAKGSGVLQYSAIRCSAILDQIEGHWLVILIVDEGEP